jgi:hypothetical protein
LLPEANEDQRLNEAVCVAFHRWPSLARRILCVKCHPFCSLRQAGWPHQENQPLMLLPLASSTYHSLSA